MDTTPGDHDFVDALFSSLDRGLDSVHDRVLRPIILVGRFVAYAFIIFLVTVVIATATVIGTVRFGTTYFFAGHVWISDAVVGALSLGIGLVLWKKRRPVALRKK